jgi:hypothetical protein
MSEAEWNPGPCAAVNNKLKLLTINKAIMGPSNAIRDYHSNHNSWSLIQLTAIDYWLLVIEVSFL